MSFLKWLSVGKLVTIIRLHGFQGIEIHWLLMLALVNLITHCIFSCRWVASYVLLLPSYQLVVSVFVLENSNISFWSLIHQLRFCTLDFLLYIILLKLLKLYIGFYVFRHVGIVLRIGMGILVILRWRLSHLGLPCRIMPWMKIFLPFILLHLLLSIACQLWRMRYLQFLGFFIILHLLGSVIIVVHLILKLNSFIVALYELTILICLLTIVFLHSNFVLNLKLLLI